jgi:prolyl oligopeptidase
MRILLLLCLAGAALAQPKPAEKKPVTATFHGVTVSDDYQWLEKADDPSVVGWRNGENTFARGVLDKLPGRAAIEARVRAIATHPSSTYWRMLRRGGRWFALKQQPPKQHPSLVSFASPDDEKSERVLVDPDALDPTHSTAIDWFTPSVDGKRLLVSLSQGGSERGSLHVFDGETGKPLPDVIPRVQVATGGGAAVFDTSGTGIYYTRYPKEGERPKDELDFWQEVWFHKLGTPVDKDVYAFGKGLPKIAEINLMTSDDASLILAEVANGDGGEFAHYLRGKDGSWKQLTQFSDKTVRARFGRDDALYLLSRKTPLGSISRLPLSDLAHPTVIVPEGKAAIDFYAMTRSRLYVADLDGGPSRVRAFDLTGKALGGLPIPPVSAVDDLARGDGEELLVQLESYVQPPTWFRWDNKQLQPTRLKKSTLADFSDSEVARELAISKDGTRVPINILRKKGLKLDGNNPTLLEGYGGYGIAMQPWFDEWLRVFVEQGGVYVMANLRGGSEFGEAWHEAGKLEKKQNVFDDFAGAARWLIDHKVTRPERLAILGASNGGLLMGATFTQHPELFRAVVSSRGIYDMLRFEAWPNGQFNTTEFGSTKNPSQFKALYAYSPYQHVESGKKYPSVLLLTGTNDVRVAPSDSYKLAARLRASSHDVLLRVSEKSGHGMGSALDEQIGERVDILAFLFDALGVKYAPAK